jgi:hypothetical protein
MYCCLAILPVTSFSTSPAWGDAVTGNGPDPDLLGLKVPEGLVLLLQLLHLLPELLVVGLDDGGQLSNRGRLGFLVTLGVARFSSRQE